MVINYDFREECAELFDLLRGTEKAILFYRCFNTPVKDNDKASTVVAFAVIEEDVREESFIDAHFTSFIEAKLYYDFLCGRLASK